MIAAYPVFSRPSERFVDWGHGKVFPRLDGREIECGDADGFCGLCHADHALKLAYRDLERRTEGS